MMRWVGPAIECGRLGDGRDNAWRWTAGSEATSAMVDRGADGRSLWNVGLEAVRSSSIPLVSISALGASMPRRMLTSQVRAAAEQAGCPGWALRAATTSPSVVLGFSSCEILQRVHGLLPPPAAARRFRWRPRYAPRWPPARLSGVSGSVHEAHADGVVRRRWRPPAGSRPANPRPLPWRRKGP